MKRKKFAFLVSKKKPMRYLLNIICLLMIASAVQAQVYQWAVSMGSVGPDQGFSISTDGDGDIYITGQFVGTVDFDPGQGIFELTSDGDRDIFVSKLNASGNFLWAKKIGGPNIDLAYSSVVDANGYIYITGFFLEVADFDPGEATYNLSSAESGSSDIFIVKLDKNGNFVWAKSIGSTSYDQGHSIAVDALGNVYTTGIFMTLVDFDPGPGIYELSSSTGFVFISKLDSDGNFVWARNIGGGTGFSITTDAGGNVYVTGDFHETADFDPGPDIYNLTLAGGSDIFLVKLDAEGNFLWAGSMGGTGYNEAGLSVKTDAAGNVYTTGVFTETADLDPGPGTYNLTSSGHFDIFITKIDSAGNFVWARQIGGPFEDRGNSLFVDDNGSVYVTGFFMETVDFDPGPEIYQLTSAGAADIFLAKLDAEGNFLWAGRLGGKGDDRGNSIAADAVGNIYSTGYFNDTADFNPSETANLISKGAWDIFVCRYSSDNVHSKEYSLWEDINIYPNPTRGDLSIHLSEEVPEVEVTIRNVSGQEVSRKLFNHYSLLNLEIRGAPGIYFLSIRSEDEVVTKKILKH